MSLAIPTGHDTLGLPLPSSLHAIAVSYPKWSDVVGFRKGESVTVSYSRFYVHRSVQKLILICQKEFGLDGELCLLCPTAQNAEYGEEFIRNQALLAGKRKSESSTVSSSQRPCRIANHALAQTL
ncbi:hypothetical protein BKA83DRAFT_12403 [Pisolithus microcarpus]|nr:hypothetical protein BKA83DRAFT_12403 [Pisolithus microcarpus]